MQEEEAKAEIFKKLWKSFLKIFSSFTNGAIKNRNDICRKLVGSGRKISTLDPDTSRSCDDICASSGKEGLTWQCKSGFNQLTSLKISCDSEKNDRTFCCCVEANTNMQFRF